MEMDVTPYVKSNLVIRVLLLHPYVYLIVGMEKCWPALSFVTMGMNPTLINATQIVKETFLDGHAMEEISLQLQHVTRSVKTEGKLDLKFVMTIQQI